ncbi:hypothetical protein Gorai_008687, partial [Gossypium raimondii]|nr:hypothetical protein [Gossypium raimondii]
QDGPSADATLTLAVKFQSRGHAKEEENTNYQLTMSYYNQQQPPVGVPPPQGYPPEGYPPKDAYPPPGYPPQGYPQGYPQQGYPPQGYPPQYAQPPPQQKQSSGFVEGW